MRILKTLYIISFMWGLFIMVVYDARAGDLAVKYETSGKGAGYISNGSSWGDPGGDSYGSYQIETKQGTMQEYLKGDDPFVNELKQLPINSRAFRDKWRELAKNDPNGFQQSQFNFISHKSNGFVSAMNFARKLGWNINNIAMQNAIFSTSNQSGGWKLIFVNTGITYKDDLATQINKLYDARAVYFKHLNINNAIKVSIMKHRTGLNLDLTTFKGQNERVDCLKLAGVIES